MDSSIVSRLRFNQLRMIVELSRSGSIRGASEAMHLTQPALSKALREIEGMLNTRLYERTPQGLTITAAGQLALRGAQLLLKELELLSDEIAELNAGRALPIRVGTTPHLAGAFLPAVVSSLAKIRPNLSIHLHESLAGELLQKLQVGELDVLVILGSVEVMKAVKKEPLQYEHLFENELQVFCHASYKLPKGRHLLANLQREKWILPAHPSLVRSAFDATFAEQGLPPPLPSYEAALLTSITSLALSGLGLGVGLAPGEPAEHLRRVKLVEPIRLPPAILLFRSTTASRPAVTDVCDAIRGVARSFSLVKS